MTRHKTADLEPTTFGGRYTLVRRLAVGGMAEIYLARQAAMAGFEKEVVIKRLRAELADDPRIVEMFLDEARIGALLNHPNIVHVYDVDEHDGIPYIAMEYIVGEELNELCRRGIAHGKFLPIEHAVELMRQAAAGLGYFHSKRGPESVAGHTSLAGQPLEIVHLDISPSNLLVTQDGFLKVIDFGIARARGQRQADNVIPGKLSYMSPEQAARGTVDARSDIFSLGIVLYEITVGKRLFRGPAQEVVEKLVAGKVEPPTFARRNFPPALEQIVLRTLEKHPDDRYQSAYDLADDLESFLRDERLHSGPVRIARYLDILTIASGGQRRPELVSELESRDGGDDLDFDQQAFDAFVPAEGAPGPEQAPEWEDAEQSEGDIAKALGMELAELRQMRTPVPTKPSGVREAGDDEDDDNDLDFDGGVTTINPTSSTNLPKAKPDKAEESDSPTNQVPKVAPLEVVRDAPPPRDTPTSLRAGSKPRPGSSVASMVAAKAEERAKSAASSSKLPVTSGRSPKPEARGPVIGASYLQRSSGSKLPWVIAGILALVVAVLVIVLALR